MVRFITACIVLFTVVLSVNAWYPGMNYGWGGPLGFYPSYNLTSDNWAQLAVMSGQYSMYPGMYPIGYGGYGGGLYPGGYGMSSNMFGTFPGQYTGMGGIGYGGHVSSPYYNNPYSIGQGLTRGRGFTGLGSGLHRSITGLGSGLYRGLGRGLYRGLGRGLTGLGRGLHQGLVRGLY